MMSSVGAGRSQRRSVRQPICVPRRVWQLSLALVSALLLSIRTNDRSAFSLLPAQHRRSSGTRTAVGLRAEGDATTELAPSPIDDATAYSIEVNQMTGELMIDGIPSKQGVYAVFNVAGKMQYIGLSRDIKKSVDGHASSFGIQEAGDYISEVKCLEMPTSSKEVLKGTWERWIKDHMEAGGEIPAGNLPESAPGAEPRWRSKSQARPPLSLAGARGIETPAEALAAVKKAVEKYPVLLFMKGNPAMPQCGFSAKTVSMMAQVGVPFESVDVLDAMANPGVRDAVKEYGNWPTIPQLYVGGELVGGCDIITELFESGQLEAQIKNAVNGGGPTTPTSSASSAADSGPVGPINLVSDPGRPTASLMSKILDENFQLKMLTIVDESAAHEGDAGALEMGLTGESHFRVEIVAPEFEGLSPVMRQKKVFDALSDVMPKVHALSLVTKTPAEF